MNEDMWCDTGFGSGDHLLPEDFLSAPYNLTDGKSLDGFHCIVGHISYIIIHEH